MTMRLDVDAELPAGDRRRPWRPIATRGLLAIVAIALGMALAACGGGSDDTAGPSASGSASAESQADQLVRFAQCMRQNGVPSFPDPVDGKLTLTVRKGGPLDPNNPQFRIAREKCKDVEPPGALGGGGQDPQQQEQMLQFVTCMRNNGVPNFPDPQNGQFAITGAQVDPNSPGFQKAIQACRNLIPGGAAVGGGQ
jgi:hypothetical protein